jgi:hypothetical protein
MTFSVAKCSKMCVCVSWWKEREFGSHKCNNRRSTPRQTCAGLGFVGCLGLFGVQLKQPPDPEKAGKFIRKAIKFYDVFGGLNKYTLIQRDFRYFHKYSFLVLLLFGCCCSLCGR